MTIAADYIPAASPPPHVARRRGWSRVIGLALLALWSLIGLGLLAFLVSRFDVDLYARYLPRVAGGILTTIELVAISLVIGAAVSVPVAAGRLSTNPLAAAPAFAFSYFFRGTPLLAQTFLVYYGAGQFNAELKAIGLWTFFRDPFYCAIFTFSLNTAAYQSEILAGAIRAVPRGQWQAAQSLALSRGTTLRMVILPQALITALRPYGNEVVLLIKGSAVAAIITVFDLMGETRYAFSKTYDLQVYLWAAVLYLVMVESLRRLWDLMEARLTRHLKR